MTAVGGNPSGGRGSTPCAWCHKRHRSGTNCPVKTRETTPRKRKPVVTWAVLDRTRFGDTQIQYVGPRSVAWQSHQRLLNQHPDLDPDDLDVVKLTEVDPIAKYSAAVWKLVAQISYLSVTWSDENHPTVQAEVTQSELVKLQNAALRLLERRRTAREKQK